MPTYDYECESCGVFEVYQGIKDTPLAACPTCGGTVRRKIGTGGGLLFKGSGFYVTDYRSKSYQDKAKAEKGGGTSTVPAPEAKKPADAQGSQADSSRAAPAPGDGAGPSGSAPAAPTTTPDSGAKPPSTGPAPAGGEKSS